MNTNKAWIEDCKDCIHNKKRIVCEGCECGELFEEDWTLMLDENFTEDREFRPFYEPEYEPDEGC